jgi:hypothetical protein
MCLKYCVPLSAACFVGVLFWQLAGLPGLSDLLPLAGSGPGATHETWVTFGEPASAAVMPAASDLAGPGGAP